jgi:hypothetical protein
MHKSHPAFQAPDNKAKVWRYMDISKFIALLDKRALFFSTVDQFDDKFEGYYSKYIFDLPLEKNLTPEGLRSLEEEKAVYIAMNEKNRRHVFVNCWHMNDDESEAMWKLYSKSSDAVAVQSTYERLSDSFKEYDEEDVYIGTVNYIDYKKQPVPLSTAKEPVVNLFYPFIHKRRSFEHERELRAVISYWGETPELMYDGDEEIEIPQPKVKSEKFYKEKGVLFGLNVPVNLDELIENIFVSPTANKWFEDVVNSVMKKYGLNQKAEKSPLADDPLN